MFLGIEKRNICIWGNKQILFTYKYELKLRRNLHHNITEGLLLNLGLEVIYLCRNSGSGKYILYC